MKSFCLRLIHLIAMIIAMGLTYVLFMAAYHFAGDLWKHALARIVLVELCLLPVIIVMLAPYWTRWVPASIFQAVLGDRHHLIADLLERELDESSTRLTRGIMKGTVGEEEVKTYNTNEAEPKLRRILQIREDKLGGDHRDLIVPLVQLALSVNQDEEEALLSRALDICDKTLKEDSEMPAYLRVFLYLRLQHNLRCWAMVISELIKHNCCKGEYVKAEYLIEKARTTWLAAWPIARRSGLLPGLSVRDSIAGAMLCYVDCSRRAGRLSGADAMVLKIKNDFPDKIIAN